MKKGIGKTISVIAILTMTFQLGMPIIPVFQNEAFAINTTTSELSENTDTTEVISNDNEIKEEETWDVSANGDESVIAKWTREDRTLTISGTGEMKDWYGDSTEDWHNTQYTNIIESVSVEEGITNIGNYAFSRCSSLERIKMPEGITNIANQAFSLCSNLTSIDIPEGVTNIGAGAFSGCTSLKNIEMPQSLINIGNSAFSRCSNLTSIYIPINVISIGYGTFADCISLEKINVDENNNQFIDENGVLFNKEKDKLICFPGGKKDLKEYEIPDTVTTIDYYAFFGNTSIENIIIPNSVENIESYSFYGCTNLENITIPDKVTTIRDYTFYNCNNLQNIYFTGDIKRIQSYAFANCNTLESISLPDSLESIGENAFRKCTILKNIEIPQNVSSIGELAFYGCSSLESINIPENVTDIKYSTFSNCSNLKNVNISEGVISIENQAFSDCTSLVNINIPASVTSIGESAFSGCNQLILYVEADSIGHKYAEEHKVPYILNGIAYETSTEYQIEEEKSWDISVNQDESVIAKWTLEDKTLTITGEGEIKNWEYKEQSDWHNNQYTTFIENAVVDNRITFIGNYMFYNCTNLKNINIPESITSIGSSAFEGCSSLINMNIPNSVTVIDDEAFSNCTSLENVVLSNNIKVIESSTFNYCISLNSIVIPETVTVIEDNAFERCTNLTNIEIPQGVTSIGDDVFYGCSNLQSINVNSYNDNYISENGILFNKEKTELIKFPEGKEDISEYSIPEGVISIKERAFYQCTNLIKVIIPDSVTTVEYATFNECSNLESIIIPEGVTTIETMAFSRCISLKKIILPSSVTKIGSQAFYDCSDLKSIVIPKNVKTIESEAFEHCDNLIIYTKSDTEGHKYAEENGQRYIIDSEGPEITFEPNGSENPQKGYSVKVGVADNQEEVGVKDISLKYQWTQSETEPTKESFTESFENGQTITKSTGDGKWYLWIYAEDNLENETITRSDAFNFDNTAPIINIEYSRKEITEDPVIVTITSNEEIQEVEGWILSSDKKALTKEYSENTNETITVKDLAGNEIQAVVEIINIGKIEIGDINQDGRIDVTDLLMLKRHLVAGSRTEWILTGRALLLADMNEDGNVDVTDMLMLKRIIVEDM